jgi:hypothetical protein
MNKRRTSLLDDIVRGKITREQLLRKAKRGSWNGPVMCVHRVAEGTVSVSEGRGQGLVEEKLYSYPEWQQRVNELEKHWDPEEISLVTIRVTRTPLDLEKLRELDD